MDFIQNFNQRLDSIEETIDRRFTETNYILTGYNTTITNFDFFIATIISEVPYLRALAIALVCNCVMTGMVLIYLLVGRVKKQPVA